MIRFVESESSAANESEFVEPSRMENSVCVDGPPEYGYKSMAKTAPFGATPPTLKLRMESARQRSMFFTLRTGSLVVSAVESPSRIEFLHNTAEII